jgi:hypothetical protein
LTDFPAPVVLKGDKRERMRQIGSVPPGQPTSRRGSTATCSHPLTLVLAVRASLEEQAMTRQPAMRASHTKDFHQFLGRSHPDVQRQLRATLSSAVLERIEQALRTDWIPVELDAQYVGGLLACLGPERMRAAFRTFTVERLARSPSVRSIVNAMLRLFGVGVDGLVRALPAGLRQSYRDAFTVEMEIGSGHARVVLTDIASEIMRCPGYLIIWEAIFLGMYDLAGVEPRLELEVSTSRRRVKADFRW